jgi:hypothetical protein
MTNEVRTANDPLGNTIFLLEDIFLSGTEANTEISNVAATAIRKPAFLVEVWQDGEVQRFYFRSTDWHNTMLLGVHFHHNRWEAFSCILNPTAEKLSDILKTGNQLL